MALFGGKKSTAVQTTNETNIGFSEVEGDAIGIVGDNNTTTDHGAIAGALDLGKLSIESSNNLAREVIGSNNQAIEGFGNQLQEFAKVSNADTGDQLAQLGRWLIVAAAVVGAAFFLKGAK